LDNETAIVELAENLADRAVGLNEVRLKKSVKEVPCEALDGVVDGEYMDSLPVLDIRALQQSRPGW
jgi:hypothetical protein